MEKELGLFDEAHLFVAAVRVLTHQKSAPPSLEEVCRLLSFSGEWGHALCRRLKAKNIIESIEDPFSLKLFVADYTKLEELPREYDKKGLGEDLEKFQKSREGMTKKVETIQAELARKKQDLFAELEAKMKKKKE